MEEKIFLNADEEYITLNEFLKLTNIISTGGQGKYYLQENEVFVDGELETRRGRKLYPGMTVKVDNSIFLIERK